MSAVGRSAARRSAARARMLLGTGMVLVAVPTLPLLGVFGLSSRAGILVPLVVAPALAFVVASALWVALPRCRTGRRAWMAALCGLAVVVATSYLPVSVGAAAVYEEWKETQPGGRGYYP